MTAGHDGEVVERQVQLGALPPLTEQTFDAERDGLAEDILNWNHGHPMVPVLVTPEVHPSS